MEPAATALHSYSKVNILGAAEREYVRSEVVGNVTSWIDTVAAASQNACLSCRRRHGRLEAAHNTDWEPAIVAIGKKSHPTWSNAKAAIQAFDRAGLQGLVKDMYALSKDNQAFLHARLGLGTDQLKPYKSTISRWINPDVMRNQPISVSKAKKAIADYKKAIGHPAGLAELSIFYCEEAFDFLDACGMEDESYFLAMIRMYDQATSFSMSLPSSERSACAERLDKLRSRARDIGWGVQDEIEDIWGAAGLDEHHDQ